MNKLITMFFCFLATILLYTPTTFAEAKQASGLISSETSIPDYSNVTESLLSLPEENIDVATAALTLAKEIYPDVDIEVYSALIDYLVETVRVMTNGSTDPEYRIRALNTYLYKIYRIQYNFSDPMGEKNFKVRTLNGVLDKGRGNCVSMPLLYLAMSQRLGYPIYAVSVPDHFFLRYVDPSLKEQNIEATGGGGYIPDETYIESLQITERGIKSGAYLRPLSHREFLAHLVAGNAVYWGRRGDHQKAIKYLELAVNVLPTSPEINDNLGRAYLIYSKKLEGDKAKEFVAKGDSYKAKALELGFVRPPQEEFLKEMARRVQEESQRVNEQLIQTNRTDTKMPFPNTIGEKR